MIARPKQVMIALDIASVEAAARASPARPSPFTEAEERQRRGPMSSHKARVACRRAILLLPPSSWGKCVSGESGWLIRRHVTARLVGSQPHFAAVNGAVARLRVGSCLEGAPCAHLLYGDFIFNCMRRSCRSDPRAAARRVPAACNIIILDRVSIDEGQAEEKTLRDHHAPLCHNFRPT